jgi:hypothetical protein
MPITKLNFVKLFVSKLVIPIRFGAALATITEENIKHKRATTTRKETFDFLNINTILTP